MKEKYKYYDGNSLQLTSELLIKANETIEVIGDEPFYDYIKNSSRFTRISGEIGITEKNEKEEEKIINNKINQVAWLKELEELPIIGTKTAKKIIKLYSTKEELIANLNNLPFDDDENKILIEKYGGN